jgi:hypothetical protein
MAKMAVVITAVAALAAAACDRGQPERVAAVATTEGAVPVSVSVRGSLPALDGRAAAWRYPAGATPDPTPLESLAAALGLTGEIVHDEHGWSITDRAGASLTVADDAVLTWTYSLGTGLTTPVPGVLSPAGREAALEVIAAAGVAVDDAGMTIERWTVTARDHLGGVASPLETEVRMTGKGAAVMAAHGHLARPSPVGTEPRIGTAAALARLRSRHVVSPDHRVYPVPQSPTTNPSKPDRGGPEPTLVDPLPAPAPDVQITAVRPALAVDAHPDGSVWLRPAYTFTAVDGTEYTVSAVP